jgi:four helix bundle protein
MKENILKSKSYAFALESIHLYKKLNSRKEFVISKQMLRSATSIGANIREANHAQSLPDFIHKLSISLKECYETQYWLELLSDSNYIEQDEFDSLYSNSIQIHKILSSSIITSKNKLRSKN